MRESEVLPVPQRPDTRDQLFLLPPSLDELIGDAHPIRYVASFVDALTAEDWAELGVSQTAHPLGAPRYAPAVLLRIWLSGFMLGIRSARGLERGCQERFDLYWAAAGHRPDHNTLSRFYAAHRRKMRQLLRATVRTAVEIGLVELAVQAVDGTKVLANASRDAAMTAEHLDLLAKKTDAAIADLEAQEEGEEGPPPDLPPTLRDARVLKERIAAVRALQASGAPLPINRTDPEASWMKTREGTKPAYNAQLVVTPTDPVVGNGSGRIILAASVTTQANDVGFLAPMIDAARVAGRPVPTTLADAGYSSQGSLLAALDAGVRVVAPLQRQTQQHEPYAKERFRYDASTDTYHCPEGEPLSRGNRTRSGGHPVTRYQADPAVCQACPAFGCCTTSPQGRMIKIGDREERIRQHATWMETEQATTLSRQRKGLIEPVFGIAKEQLGARRTLLRGRVNVEAEWMLTATAFNLRTLARAMATRPAA
jgi:transposase